MKSFFISGTDTGVGKTTLCGAIARSLVQMGKNVGVMKPFETGCRAEGSRMIPSDALFLKKMSCSTDDMDSICPCCYKLPLAPYVAGKIEDRKFEIRPVLEKFMELGRKHEIVLVEGAGGLLVPLMENYFTTDLIKDLDIPVIIVSRLGLGTINHTLLSVKHALACGLEVAGIIMNQASTEYGHAEKTNPEIIKRFSTVSLLGIVPFIEKGLRDNPEELADIVSRSLDLSVFI